MKKAAPKSAVKTGVIYIRVSSKEQESEGYSLTAQVKLLRDYAKRNCIKILKVFKDAETAKTVGRTQFKLMVKFLSENSECNVVLVEKTDRLYRNFKDCVTLEEMNLELHIVKEGEVITNDSSSNSKMMHGFRIVMAKGYIDNLSEESRKGMLAKAESGMFPSVAPVGYENYKTPEGRRAIRPDPVMAPIVKNLFEIFRTGDVSISQLTRIAKVEGLKRSWNQKTRPMGKSTIHRILRSPIYKGDFKWKGEQYSGSFEPIVSRQLWSEVEAVLVERNKRKTKQRKHNFAFSRLVKCGHCGCSLVGETHKGRYTYYSCSAYKGRCGEPYVREGTLDEQFCQHLESLEFEEEILTYLKDIVGKITDGEREHRRSRLSELKSRLSLSQRKLGEIYEDKLEGLISSDIFKKKSDKYKLEMEDLRASIAAFESLEDESLHQGIETMDFVRNAHRMYLQQSSSEKRNLLKNLLSNSSWKDGKLSVEFRQPYDMIVNTKKLHDQKKAAGELPGGLYPIWRSGRDSNSQLPT